MAPYRIQCLVPDLPDPLDVQPYLADMHAARWYSNFGPLNTKFEAAMKQFLLKGTPDLDIEVATFTSATAALEAALRALNLPDHGKVLIPAVTFPATALAVINAGLTPVFADVDADSWELMPHHARAFAGLVAVMPVSAFGKPVSVPAWEDFTRETGLPVIVDAAAALGQQVVSNHLHVCFSLHATKPFGVGEGGLLITPDKTLLHKCRSWSNFGFGEIDGVITRVGTNAKMGEFYAATGLAQMDRWETIFSRRQAVLDWYHQELAPLDNKIRFQKSDEGFVPATFMVHTDGKAKAIARALNEAGIHTRFWYLPPLYAHPALKDYYTGKSITQDFPVAEELNTSLLGLPFHAFLTREDVAEICSIVSRLI